MYHYLDCLRRATNIHGDICIQCENRGQRQMLIQGADVPTGVTGVNVKYRGTEAQTGARQDV